MKTPDQIQEYLDVLARQGVKPRDAAPPLYRWLWRKGINIAPPFSQTFIRHFIVITSFWVGFMAIVGTLLFMLLNQIFGTGGWIFIKSYLIQSPFYPAIGWGGIFLGLITAGYVKYRSKSLTIPPW